MVSFCISILKADICLLVLSWFTTTFTKRKQLHVQNKIKQTKLAVTTTIIIIEPWPNRVASRRKFSTCVYLPFCLTRNYMHLRWLAMNCTHFDQEQICTQADARFWLFGRPTQVNPSWVTSIDLWSANEIQDMSALNFFIATFVY